jgi:hypothetical protein
MLWTLLILLVLMLIVLGSSLNDETRKIILDFLIGAIQVVLPIERRSRT